VIEHKPLLVWNNIGKSGGEDTSPNWSSEIISIQYSLRYQLQERPLHPIIITD